MKVIAAYILAVLGGNETPAAADITKILESVGADVDSDKVTQFLSEVEGKNIWNLIDEGKEKLGAAPVAAVGGAAAPAAGGDAAGDKAAAEKKADESASDDDPLGDDGGFDLFGGGDDDY
mmetsp:Transcript_12484/g.18863  ORF Transcript_12484/g.18863 Transcript_12484/m.18863 type:complete len:120 (-) Transcript_12484:175-534(-)|eukprot:CAMPEP_0201544044 /NCGR_PEP_ID=MMETSP0173_2-20130828/483_1 /ASSEMBLY_ACC=CAM_ASM_000268 /TAXON_ID=218659 /ORGANISM="Vexillifera sp., Strain DIVA3 564/2" /LENGTH=119 /DNA_ID=CAMNT_0047952029 /DNA_START=59 /DNA_END=418 /DNA_ORIENTATION=-